MTLLIYSFSGNSALSVYGLNQDWRFLSSYMAYLTWWSCQCQWLVEGPRGLEKPLNGLNGPCHVLRPFPGKPLGNRQQCFFWMGTKISSHPCWMPTILICQTGHVPVYRCMKCIGVIYILTALLSKSLNDLIQQFHVDQGYKNGSSQYNRSLSLPHLPTHQVWQMSGATNLPFAT